MTRDDAPISFAVTGTVADEFRTEYGFDAAAQAHIDGSISPNQLTMLKADEAGWLRSLWRLLDEAEMALAAARKLVRGPQRSTILEDLDGDCYLIDDAITALTGELPPADVPTQSHRRTPTETPVLAEIGQLQLSCTGGNLVAWVGGHNATLGSHPEVVELLGEFGASGIDWQPGPNIKVPAVGRASTAVAPLVATLGWLVAHARPTGDQRQGVSVGWMGLVAAAAV